MTKLTNALDGATLKTDEEIGGAIEVFACEEAERTIDGVRHADFKVDFTNIESPDDVQAIHNLADAMEQLATQLRKQVV